MIQDIVEYERTQEALACLRGWPGARGTLSRAIMHDELETGLPKILSLATRWSHDHHRIHALPIPILIAK